MNQFARGFARSAPLSGSLVIVALALVACHRPPPPPPPAPPAQSPAVAAASSAPTPAASLPDFEVNATQVFEGDANWYDVPDNSLAQRRAWPGEFTAACDRVAPGAYARVRRLDAKADPAKSVVVRITDHGVGRQGTVIDLDREAAAELGMVKAGQVRVRMEVLALKNASADKPVEKKSGPPLTPKASDLTDQPTANQQQEKDHAAAKTDAP